MMPEKTTQNLTVGLRLFENLSSVGLYPLNKRRSIVRDDDSALQAHCFTGCCHLVRCTEARRNEMISK